MPAPEGQSHCVGIDAAAGSPAFWYLSSINWPPPLLDGVAHPLGLVGPLVEVASLVQQRFRCIIEREAGGHTNQTARAGVGIAIICGRVQDYYLASTGQIHGICDLLERFGTLVRKDGIDVLTACKTIEL